ncbi:hypothetical protein R1flu_025874 [Riccia fluitans]|uniref:SHSP domain-containing protein n=1 Tax=Riccia fluitans TaxID=41844 RepID=A0ABD1XYZ9_9MARC
MCHRHEFFLSSDFHPVHHPSVHDRVNVMKKDDMKIQMPDDHQRRAHQGRNGGAGMLRDAYFGKFYRQFQLIPNTKPQGTSAKSENGVLI